MKILEQFKDNFNKENRIYYEIFIILFNAKNGQNIKSDILKFNRQYPNRKLSYDFTDIIKFAKNNN